MTRIEAQHGKACPFLHWDECGRKIEDIGMAMAAWTWDNPRVYHVHKGSCLDALERRISPDDWLLTEELTTHLYHMLRNHGLKMPKPPYVEEYC